MDCSCLRKICVSALIYARKQHFHVSVTTETDQQLYKPVITQIDVITFDLNSNVNVDLLY